MIIMKTKMTKYILSYTITILAAFAISTATYAEIKVSQSLAESKIAFEDTAHFEILVEWEGSQMAYRFNKPLSPYIDRLKIGKFSSSVSTNVVEGKEITLKKYSYALIPTSAGLGLIDSISIAYMQRHDSLPGFVVTEPMEILIANPTPKKIEEGFDYWLLYAFLVVVIIGIFSFLRIQKKKQSAAKPLTAKEQFLEDLSMAKSNAASDMKIFQTELYTALSKYIVTEHKVDVSTINNDNHVDELSKAGMSISKAEQISKWLQQAEIDKYAPITNAPGAVVRLESEIRTFFEMK